MQRAKHPQKYSTECARPCLLGTAAALLYWAGWFLPAWWWVRLGGGDPSANSWWWKGGGLLGVVRAPRGIPCPGLDQCLPCPSEVSLSVLGEAPLCGCCSRVPMSRCLSPALVSAFMLPPETHPHTCSFHPAPLLVPFSFGSEIWSSALHSECCLCGVSSHTFG